MGVTRRFSYYFELNCEVINMADDQMSEIDKRKKEVRERMEAQARNKKKKGFMTPERKKKLRLLLRKKAAEELKKEQERKSAERRKVIDQRCGKPSSTDGMSESELRALCQTYQDRICAIESDKYDTEKRVEFKDYEITELNIAVNDLRGKYIKPTLKKVSKYENKFAKLQKEAAKFNFQNQLKTVKKKEFTLEEEDKEHEKKPDWVLGEKEGKSKSTSEAPPEAHEAVAAAEEDAVVEEEAIA